MQHDARVLCLCACVTTGTVVTQAADHRVDVRQLLYLKLTAIEMAKEVDLRCCER